MDNGTCSIAGCDRPCVARGWCAAHWYRWSRHGDPLADRRVELYRAIDHEDGTRTCSKCRERKPLDEFHKVKAATLGRRSDCKVCRTEQVKAWYAANRERQAEKERERKAADPEKYRERDKARAHLPQRRALASARSARRRARIADLRIDRGVTRDNLRQQYGDNCFYCTTPMSFDRLRKGDVRPINLATIEHVVPVSQGGSHTWDNVVLACWRCNSSKKASPLATWRVPLSPSAPA